MEIVQVELFETQRIGIIKAGDTCKEFVIICYLGPYTTGLERFSDVWVGFINKHGN